MAVAAGLTLLAALLAVMVIRPPQPDPSLSQPVSVPQKR
jgi:hypothetical protein